MRSSSDSSRGRRVGSCGPHPAAEDEEARHVCHQRNDGFACAESAPEEPG